MTQVGSPTNAMFEDFRSVDGAERLLEAIARLDSSRELRVMHVCGTHENALCEFGLRRRLPKWLKLVAGPGCPVCVCPAADIDMALRLSMEHHAIVATFGDVVRVPAARITLLEAKARGGECRVVYGIDDAIKIALDNPNREVVFFAVGFETTACTTAAALLRGLPSNFSVLCSHRLVPPALHALLDMEGTSIDGFILPGHATTVTGLEDYVSLGDRSITMAVAGFEPVDLLLAIRDLAERLIAGPSAGRVPIYNAYPRAVRGEGNTAARRIMEQAFEVCDAAWRGIGVIPGSGYRIRPHLTAHDAAVRFGIEPDPSLPDMHKACRCGDVLLGRIDPEACPLFEKACHPDHPIGPCMVAFEGTCHARYRHGRPRQESA